MNDMTQPETLVEVEDIGIDASEQALGVVDKVMIKRKRVTVIIVESSDGYQATGHHCGWPGQHFNEDISRAKANRYALESLKHQRAKKALCDAGRTPPRKRRAAP